MNYGHPVTKSPVLVHEWTYRTGRILLAILLFPIGLLALLTPKYRCRNCGLDSSVRISGYCPTILEPGELPLARLCRRLGRAWGRSTPKPTTSVRQTAPPHSQPPESQ